MNCGDVDLSPSYIPSHNGPYNSSLASSASSSSNSVWSDAASQSSDDSSVHSGSNDSETSNSYFCASKPIYQQAQNTEAAAPPCWSNTFATVPIEQRQNSRRTSVSSAARSGCPPALVRQCDRKVNFVDSLVDSSAQIVEAIWPLSSIACRTEMGSKGVLPLRTFIQETLRRSRTSYSTLQVALYYLILIKPHVPKTDFTMEQSEDAHSFRALQCGRRMFLSALILASKYLQDRNYSARAWSKISGLNTPEINQNEMAFLLAVNWKLHITDDVFTRWTDIVLKYTPQQPPSPGSFSSDESTATWHSIILGLNPELDNVDDITPSAMAKAAVQSISRSSRPIVERSFSFEGGSNESTPTPRYYKPHAMEPSPSVIYPSARAAPALGLLPTPRLTPHSDGCRTPAVNATSNPCKPSMSFAMAQACAAQCTEKWATSSPTGYNFPRRSSLANSVSSMSSPESMVSDSSSRSSRSSSISSASSLMSAPVTSKLDVQARRRYAKQCNERSTRLAIATVPEYNDEPSSSPESYSTPVGKDFIDLSRDLSLITPLARKPQDIDYFSKDSINDAARTLQELQNCPRVESQRSSPSKGSKRTRPVSIDHPSGLQDSVRDMLHRTSSEISWSENLVHVRSSMRSLPYDNATSIVNSIPRDDGRKRVCCSTEASLDYPRLAGPGMWEGLLR